MRKIFKICGVLVFVLFSSIYANNVQVENVNWDTLANNANTKKLPINFDISWDNSWRDGTNYDGVWVFMKFNYNGVWYHANVAASGHSVGTDNGITPAISVGTTGSNGMGVFLYRSGTGTGSINWDDVSLVWDWSGPIMAGVLPGDTLVGNEVVTVKVFAVEMVYIPQGSFELGDASSGGSAFHFFPYNDNTSVYSVTSQGAITVGTTAGDLYATGQINSGTTNANFPTGYNAFWMMKYEITASQYRDFLNTLTYTQQDAVTWSSPSAVSKTGALASSTNYRNLLQIKTSGVNNSVPAVYGCNLDNDSDFDEATDGQHIPVLFLAWTDGRAYADWAGLRPFTELEYEKACRGTATAIAGEYAWGTIIFDNLKASEGVLNPGAVNETLGAEANATVGNNFQGPARCGIHANYVSDNYSGSSQAVKREKSGGSFYGVMELSGSLWEQVISIGNHKNFQGTHGDGNVSAPPGDWPANSGVRGSNWANSAAWARVSDRQYALGQWTDRYNSFGFRAARTAE